MVKIVDKYIRDIKGERADKRNYEIFRAVRAKIPDETITESRIPGHYRLYVGKDNSIVVDAKRNVVEEFLLENSRNLSSELALSITKTLESRNGEKWNLERYHLR